VEALEDSLAPGTPLVDATTSTPETTNEVAEALVADEVTVLGAPISGANSAVATGEVTVIVSGDAADLDDELTMPSRSGYESSLRP
jgi:3-hydroxyisobutyrate dehydrogenase-like beta-hydroxyacid dehydrogenase